MANLVCQRCVKQKDDVEPCTVTGTTPFKINYCGACRATVARQRTVVLESTGEEVRPSSSGAEEADSSLKKLPGGFFGLPNGERVRGRAKAEARLAELLAEAGDAVEAGASTHEEAAEAEKVSA